jgi:glutathione S-transferase
MDINGGLIPILELPNGTILLDSKIILDYINESTDKTGYNTLPEDPVQRALMRMHVTLAEQFFATWQGVIMKRVYSEDEMKAFRVKLQAIEDFIVKNGNAESPFCTGTERPT